jgi:DNA repair protein RadA/Sms
MAKISTRYICQDCGYDTPRWMGKCPECGAFNTFAEEKVAPQTRGASGGAGSALRSAANTPGFSKPLKLSDVTTQRRERLLTGMSEFDRVLGGGLVPGSLILIGGDPGIGKSTLLLEASVRLAERYGSGLYISGEESAEQIRLRADRLALTSENLMLVAETDLSIIEAHIRDAKCAFVIIDSIQTVAHPGLESAPGTLTQVREGAAAMQRLAKDSGTPIFLVGHVNKEGNLAGPRALEHIVDAVLQLEGDEHYNFRILRSLKNRFGSTNELGVFQMTEGGMEGVENPSQLFLSERQSTSPGSCVVATVEGSRPLLVEVQALCAPSYFTAPRRTVTGADFNRVNVALAVIEKRLGMRLGDMDVYVNVVGGVRISEPALDLGIALAVISSLHDIAIPADACVFGEVGLAGEVRAVSHADRRATEAARLGFSRCIVPRAVLQKLPARLESGDGETMLRGAGTLRDAVQHLLPEALNKRSPRGESSGPRLASAGQSSQVGHMGRRGGAGRAERGSPEPYTDAQRENADVRSNTGAYTAGDYDNGAYGADAWNNAAVDETEA